MLDKSSHLSELRLRAEEAEWIVALRSGSGRNGSVARLDEERMERDRRRDRGRGGKGGRGEGRRDGGGEGEGMQGERECRGRRDGGGEVEGMQGEK